MPTGDPEAAGHAHRARRRKHLGVARLVGIDALKGVQNYIRMVMPTGDPKQQATPTAHAAASISELRDSLA